MSRIKSGLLIALFLLGILLFSPQHFIGQKMSATAEKIDPAEVKTVNTWLCRDSISLKSVKAGHGFNDLKPLKKILKNVRIVGLGEATHGTREFFQFKHRMLEFLVKEMGYTVFAIEASYPACLNINDYVLYGKGDRAKALTSLGFWTWNTNEVSEMIEWMREYNKKVPEEKKIKFYGFDLQILEQAIDIVINYLKTVAPDYLEKAETAIKPLRIDRKKLKELANASEEEKTKNQSRLYEMIGFLAFNKIKFIRNTSVSEYEKVMQHARTLCQLYDTSMRPPADPYVIDKSLIRQSQDSTDSGEGRRDLYMAENIEYIANSEKSDTRIVVWAHNTHISIKKHTYMGWRNFSPMGFHLRNVFGDAYYALGFVFYKGSFQCRNMDTKDPRYGATIEFTIGPAQKGSVEWFLNKPEIGNFIIDFRSAPKEEKIANWLSSNHLSYNIGGGFSYTWNEQYYIVPTVLEDHFDGVVFFEKTTRARPN